MVSRNLTYHINDLTADLLNLIWPATCQACGERLFKTEEAICTNCLTQLPRTNYHLWAENDFHKLFWGRIPVMYATALYLFEKESPYRKLIHKLKYKNMPEIGIVLGREMGFEIKDSVFNEIDLIIPVPLHPKKKKMRGYNQSDMIAKGLSEGMDKPWRADILKRDTHTTTQTRKGRYERWENVNSIFSINPQTSVHDMHILVIDDVVTTGATLESCVAELLVNGASHVSLATLAFAHN